MRKNGLKNQESKFYIRIRAEHHIGRHQEEKNDFEGKEIETKTKRR